MDVKHTIVDINSSNTMDDTPDVLSHPFKNSEFVCSMLSDKNCERKTDYYVDYNERFTNTIDNQDDYNNTNNSLNTFYYSINPIDALKYAVKNVFSYFNNKHSNYTEEETSYMV